MTRAPDPDRRAEGGVPSEGTPPYEPPAIVLERRIEAVANTCAFDPPLTKSNAMEGCASDRFITRLIRSKKQAYCTSKMIS